MAFGLLLPLRIAQAVFGAVVIALSAYVAHWYNTDTLAASPSQINFLIFVGLFNFLSIAYLEITPRFAPRASHPYASFAIEILNVLFFFAGFIALAVFLGRLLFCRGSVCGAARADAAFAALNWALWMATTVMVAMEVFKGGFRRSNPSNVKMAPMTQSPLGA